MHRRSVFKILNYITFAIRKTVVIFHICEKKRERKKFIYFCNILENKSLQKSEAKKF
jgi:hypothetical protein